MGGKKRGKGGEERGKGKGWRREGGCGAYIFHLFVRCMAPNRPNSSTAGSHQYINAFCSVAVALGYSFTWVYKTSMIPSSNEVSSLFWRVPGVGLIFAHRWHAHHAWFHGTFIYLWSSYKVGDLLCTLVIVHEWKHVGTSANLNW